MFKKNIALLICSLFTVIGFAQDKVESGKLNADQMLFEYGIYYTADSGFNKSEIVKLVRKKYPSFEIIDSISNPEEVEGAQLAIYEIENAQEDFTPPSLEYLEYSSRGLNVDQKNILQDSDYAVVLDFMCEDSKLLAAMKDAHNLVLELTKDDNDVIWDAETRQFISKEYWKEYRMISDKSVNISDHTTIHMYRDGEYCRAITLGMSKFGLPDVCVENLSCEGAGSMGTLINLTTQIMFEKNKVDKAGMLSLDIESIKNKGSKNEFLESLYENAEKKIDINIIKGEREEGDPDNRLLEIGFPKDNPQIEQNALLSELFGYEDNVVTVDHDDAIMAASEHAYETVLEMYDDFKKGFPAGTHLLIKFPFDNEEGDREWMWVEVVSWKDKTVKGLLQNDPQMIKDLKSGQEVKKHLDLMFDYILYRPDGSSEGNETGKLMQQQR